MENVLFYFSDLFNLTLFSDDLFTRDISMFDLLPTEHAWTIQRNVIGYFARSRVNKMDTLRTQIPKKLKSHRPINYLMLWYRLLLYVIEMQ